MRLGDGGCHALDEGEIIGAAGFQRVTVHSRPSNGGMSRFDIGWTSLVGWRGAGPRMNAVPVSASTSPRPVGDSKQSVRSGRHERVLLALSRRQKSQKPIARRDCRAFLWFLAAMAAIASDFAMAEIALRDLAEYTGETGGGVAVLGQIRGTQQVLADLRAGRRRHLLGADHQHDSCGVRIDGTDALPDGGRPGRARILDACRRLETQAVVGLQHEARCEILGGEAGVEMSEHDLVDIVGADAGMVEPVVIL